MLYKVIIGSVLAIIAFSSMSNASAVCCFPWEITHHVDPETGFLVVSGELWNDSYKREPFGKTSYQFIFEDENRNVLFEKDLLLTEHLPVNGGFVIPYAVSFPFQIIIDDVDKDLIKKVTLVHTGGTNTLDYLEWKPADLELSFETLKNIKTIHSKTTDDVFTKWQITGKITNTHSEKTENVYVLASLFEEHDRFVGVAGYGEEDIQPLKLDGYETKDFIIHAIVPEEKKPDQVKLYAESDDSSMIHRAFMPLILKDTTYHKDRMSEGYKKPIPLSAKVINTSRDNVDFEWIIQIKKSPKGLSEGDVGKYPDSKIEEIKYISSHVDGQKSTQLEYSWIPQHDGIYFYEYFIWADSQALSFPFKGTFLQDTWMIADSSNDSLKNQLKSGTPFDSLECRFELELVQKSKTGNFVCVKSVTKQLLMDRGWAEPVSFDKIQNNPDLMKQNIIRMENGRISLYPENTCASISLQLPTEKEIQGYKNDERGLNESNTLQITSNDFNDIPIIEELIYVVNTVEFPYNKYSSAYLDGLTFVEYEFFLMEKAIEKYNGSQKDYFIKFDNDYKERFANPAKQGFTNTFEAPLIVYNNQTYSVGGTKFWVSDEHKPKRMNVYPDEIKEDEKFIVLTDEDMKSVPKIKQAIEDIGTIQESINGRKGLPEDQWNEYREWFKQKSQEQLNTDRFRLIQYDEQFYLVGFGIC
jgi:hypothetical protein